MARSHRWLMVPMIAAGLAVVTGCAEDPKKRITLLENENQQLLDQLSSLRAQADTAERDRDMCEQELASLKTDRANLLAQISDLESADQNVPQGWTPVPGGAMLAIPGEVLFRSGKAELRSEAQRVLDQVAQVVNSEYPTREVLVFGHTDNVPIKKSGWKDNYELSAQRALAVVRYLQSRGVSPGRMVAGGCGEHRPTVPNESATSQAKNRRVEIFVLEAAVQRAGG